MQRDFMSGLFWLFFGVALCIWSSTYEVGMLTSPETGFMPMMLGALMIIFSLVLIVRSVRSKMAERGKQAAIFRGDWKKALWTLVVLTVAGLLFEQVGYLLTFFFLPLVLMIVAGLKSWKQVALVAFCTALGIYICFVLLLKQPLPVGFIGV